MYPLYYTIGKKHNFVKYLFYKVVGVLITKIGLPGRTRTLGGSSTHCSKFYPFHFSIFFPYFIHKKRLPLGSLHNSPNISVTYYIYPLFYLFFCISIIMFCRSKILVYNSLINLSLSSIAS